MEIDNYIDDFKKRVDRNAIPVSQWNGEFGRIARIMYNGNYNMYYHLHYRRDWFYKFGVLFSDRIPESDQTYGTSVTMKQLEYEKNRNTYMVLRHDTMFYGCHVKDWNDYVTQYNTIHNKKEIDSMSEGCIPLNMLFDMEGFKNKA